MFWKKYKRDQLDVPFKEWEKMPLEYRQKNPPPDATKFVGKYAPDKEGMGIETHIIGEKYPFKGKPTHDSLGHLTMIKALIDKLIQSRLATFIVHEMPLEELSKPSRVLYEEMDNLIDAEKLESHKKDWRNYKKVLIYFFENDLAYRYRLQWLFERMAKRIDEWKLDDGDKYHARVKNFRVDLDEDWKDLVKKFPQLKDKKVSKEFKKVLYDEANSDCCYGNNSKQEDLAKEFLKL